MTVLPTLTTHIRVNEGVLFQDLHGEGVLLNLKTGLYLGVNPVGTRVWQLLERYTALADIRDALLAEYEVAEERIAEDLLAFVAEMEKRGLVSLF